MIKRLIEKLKALRIYAVMGSSSNKHDCRKSREVIEKLPLLEGDSYMSPPKYYVGDIYNVKCKICDNSWWQDYP
jgi:hypothetical protein